MTGVIVPVDLLNDLVKQCFDKYQKTIWKSNRIENVALNSSVAMEEGEPDEE